MNTSTEVSIVKVVSPEVKAARSAAAKKAHATRGAIGSSLAAYRAHLTRREIGVIFAETQPEQVVAEGKLIDQEVRTIGFEQLVAAL